MKSIYPLKLNNGDVVRVVAPSGSLQLVERQKQKRAERVLSKQWKLNVGISSNAEELTTVHGTGSLDSRLDDLHDAFRDPSVKALIAATGGEVANQLLPHIDFKLIKSCPKIMCGYSDLTPLLNAITAKTGLTTYYGPNFSGFGSRHGQYYTLEYARRALLGEASYSIVPSKTWYDKDYSHKKPLSKKYPSTGWWSIREGIAEGALFGGEVSSFALLHGTTWLPQLKGSVLMLEQFMGSLAEFDRVLESILQQKGGDKLEGLLIGRFQKSAKISRGELTEVITSKPQLEDVPVLANIDFGHTNPKLTLPIGGIVQFDSREQHQRLRIGEH